MSHFPVDQPSSLIPVALQPSPLTYSQDAAVEAADRYFASYAANVVCTVTGDTLLFTTDSNRGHFMPLMVLAVCQRTYNGGSIAISSPVLSVGFESGNNYRNFVNQKGLTPAGDIVSGQWERGDPTTPSTNYDVWGIELEMSQYGRAAPPSTGIYARIAPASSGLEDIRTIVVLGLYMG